MDSCTMPQSIPISKHSLIQDAVSFTRGLRTSLQADFHASLSQLQENDKPRMTQGTSGLTRLNAFAEYDRGLRFWKTSQVYLVPSMSGEYTETWPKSGIMLDGVCWEQTIVAPHINVKGGGVWRTPMSCDYKNMTFATQEYLSNQVRKWLTPSTIIIEGKEDRVEKRTAYRKSIGRKYVPGCLAEQVKWPTPRSGNPGSRPNKKGGKVLAEEVKKWPTPRQFMHKDTNIDRNKGNLGEKVGGQLSADWVEWLMGWPIFWTSLKPIKEMFWLDWSVDPADDGSIPRTATGVKDRVNRLKAIGNGQVPQVAAMAWNVLA